MAAGEREVTRTGSETAARCQKESSRSRCFHFHGNCRRITRVSRSSPTAMALRELATNHQRRLSRTDDVGWPPRPIDRAFFSEGSRSCHQALRKVHFFYCFIIILVDHVPKRLLFPNVVNEYISTLW